MTPVDTLSTFIVMGLATEAKEDDRLHRRRTFHSTRTSLSRISRSRFEPSARW